MTDALALPAVPGYRLERPLGRGAAAQVFLARESGGLERPVALKIFGPAERAAFESEIAVLPRIEELRRREREVHIVQSLGSGAFPGGWFIAFELLERGSLADLVAAEGPLACDRALALVRDAARGVARLHREGLYHRDLKPGNLLLGADGRVRLGDFGIARPLEGTVTAAGSPAFAAPEVIAGRRDADGRRVDIYGLGATLYFLLANEAMLPGRPDVFALERARVPRPVQEAILRATAARAEERPADVEAFLRDLEISEKSRGSSDGPAALVETETATKPREEIMTITPIAPPPAASRPFMPFWGYALIVGITAAIVFNLNIIVHPYCMQTFSALSIELPRPTMFYLSYPWEILCGIMLTVVLYPLLARLPRASRACSRSARSSSALSFASHSSRSRSRSRS